MRDIVIAVGMVLMLAAAVVTYAFLMRTVFPRCLMRIGFDVGDGLGRGLKRYRYPSGRGIAYEPHPSVRKYVRRYVLFTTGGYKYLKCQIDGALESLAYSVIMFDRRGGLIDVLDVDERVGDVAETAPLLVHHDTSYVALTVNRVNGKSVKRNDIFRYKLSGVIAYAATVSAVSFGMMLLGGWVLEEAVHRFTGVHYLLFASPVTYILPALLLGAISTLLMLRSGRRKGVRVVLK